MKADPRIWLLRARPARAFGGGHRSPRAAAAWLLIVAQLALSGCAAVGPRSVPSRRELVSIVFARPRSVAAPSGRESALYSVIGVVERVSADTLFLRIADATAAGEDIDGALAGERISVLRDEAARLVILDEDTSGAIAAATVLATLAALAAGVYIALGIGFSGGY